MTSKYFFLIFIYMKAVERFSLSILKIKQLRNYAESFNKICHNVFIMFNSTDAKSYIL